MSLDTQHMAELRQLYREKNDHLEQFYEPVTAYEFYREIFSVGSFERKGVYEDQKGNGRAVTIPPKGTKGSNDGENGIALEIEGGRSGEAVHDH